MRGGQRARGALLVAALVCAAPGAAHADPWANGVAAKVQAKANALFAEANQLFAQQAHGPALDKYRQAIALWDHPLIRFNMSVTLIRLDRVLEAADELDGALRYGEAPFTPELYQQALDYQRLIGGRVGVLEASCTQTGGQVSLDGKRWFACPGTQQRRVLAGEHVLLAEREGFLTRSRRVVVAGGATMHEALELIPIDVAVRLEYPVPRWIPWTIAGVGAAIGIGGLGLYVAGQNQLDQVADDFAIECPRGCDADLSSVPALASAHDSAMLKGQIAVSMMVAGGAVVVGGVAWAALFNRPRRVMPTLEVAPAGGGMTAQLGWSF